MANEVFDKKHYPGLDVLRGVAVLLVITFHFFVFTPGWMGVDLFFVLSGFLITLGLLQTKHRRNYFQSFFVRRALRTFPLYFFVLALFYAAAPFVFSQKQAGTVYDYYLDHQAWFWTFTQNWLLIKHGLPSEPYLQHFWSLGVEEQFYIVWPFLIYLNPTLSGLRKLLVCISFIALCLRFYLWQEHSSTDAFYYHTLARADSLAAGGFLATLYFEGKRFADWQTLFACGAFISLLLASYFLFGNWRLDNPLFATIGYSFTALFFMMACERVVYRKWDIKKWQLLTFFGRISYGLYVFHIPVFLLALYFLTAKVKTFLPTPQLVRFFIAIVSIILTLAISLASYHFLEKPFFHLKRKLTE